MMKLYTNTMAFLYTFKKDERGVTAIEYGLIGVAMAMIVGAAFASDGDLRKNLADAYDQISASIAKVNTKA
ncbi:Flp family type IVb pilin [Photobacterium sp. SDRW27]|uniref:Flp family type IVb pilin n=1 Tax=Photobacterium obscurum TaxID=2829490 RepID=UPI0022433581|nr:Flp family type IVb pilin [Photobacterium obscurum]MCW8327413.1 Flp family type IVb pilin [Photobacterium obscurum]